MNNLLKIFIVFMALLFVAEASHFRFGSISWAPTTTYNTIKFNSNFAFRTTFFKSSKTSITIGESITVGTMSFGTSTLASQSVILTVTAFDPVNDWFTGSFTTTKTYPTQTAGAKSTYVVIFTDCCRISSLLNNADGSWNVTTSVQVENAALTAINSSPVSGMLPIYNVNYGKNNHFDIIASDPENDPLTFKFSTVYSMSQPSGMTIQSNGSVYFKPTQIGLYSTQIYISDSKGAYIVVDFLLNSVSQPGTCNSNCQNQIACTTNAQCGTCGTNGVDSSSTWIDVCNTNVKPPYFGLTTPDAGAVLTFPVNQTSTFNLNCSAISTNVPSVQQANIPAGFSSTIKSYTTPTLSSVNTYTWKPTVTDAGSYVVSAYCTDTAGLTSEVRSFTIFVGKPSCGAGVELANKVCQCPTGWDPATNCFDCLDGYYGKTCSPSTDCNGHGTSNDGVNGDGKCVCYNGWSGSTCSVSVSQSCASIATSNTSTIYSNPSYINPTTISVYVKSSDTYTVPFIYSIPYPLPSLNVYVLVDVNAPSSTVFGYLKSYMSTLITNVKKFGENPQFGLGYFSDAPSASFNFQPSLVMGSAIDAGINTYTPSSYLSTSTYNSLNALTTAANNPLGWVSGAYKTIIVITDSDCSDVSADTTNLISALTNTGIMPVIIGYNTATLTNWNKAITTAGFGTVIQAGITSDFATKAQTALNTTLRTMVFTQSDPYNVISSTPAAIPIAWGKDVQSTSTDIKVKLPASTSGLPAVPTAIVSAMGYGSINVKVSYNRAPVAVASGITCNQNGNVAFKLSATDADSNIIKFRFATLPTSSQGTITAGGVAVNTTALYDSTTSFTFTAFTNFVDGTSFTFVANDGCVDSTPGTVTVSINRINQAPTCSAVTVNSNGLGGSPVAVTLKGSDFEDGTQSSKDYTIFASLTPISGLGAFTASSTPGSAALTTSSKVYLGSVIYFNQTANVASSQTVTVLYVVYDSSLAPSTACAITINLVHTNVAPVASSNTPVKVNPLTTVAITLNGTDSDSSSITFTITSTTSPANDGSKFYLCSDSTKSALVLNTPTSVVSLSSTKAYLSGYICYDAPDVKDLYNYASITYYVTDNEGLKSNSFTISINVLGDRPNVAPVITQIPDFTVYQDSTTNTAVYVTGTDADPSDQGKLVGVISAVPTNGTLLVGPTASSSVVTGSAPLSVIYVPTKGTYGTDTFSYYVYDTFKNASQIATTKITIVRINHAPSVSLSSYTYTSQSSFPGTITATSSDPDQDSVTCNLVTLPSVFKAYDYSTGAELKANDVITFTKYSNFFKVSVDPSKTTPPYSSFTDSFAIQCTDQPQYYGSPLKTPVVTGNIYFTYINTPPTTSSFNVTLDENTDISLGGVITGSDLETPNNISVVLYSLPTNGMLSYNGVNITTTSGIYALKNLNNLVYTPNQGMSDFDTNYSPLDKISFSILDGGDYSNVGKGALQSSTVTGTFSVTPRNPPIYTGVDTIDVLQNTRYPITLTGKIGNGGVEVNLKVVAFSGRGNLSITSIMGSEGYKDTLITSYPTSLTPVIPTNGISTYNLAYMPPTNEYGQNFDTIDFILYDRDIYSGTYRIIVNVIHVNQPPTIKAISYLVNDAQHPENTEVTFDDTLTVNMNVNTSVLIKYQGNDVDVGSILTSLVTNIPPRGVITTKAGAVISSPSDTISADADGYYYIIFTPIKSQAFTRYAQIPLVIRDEFGLISNPAKIVINVNSVNIAPVVTIDSLYSNYTFNVKDIVSVKGITATDPDSTNNNIQCTISLVDANDAVVSNKAASFNLTYSPGCTFDKSLASAVCVNTKQAIQSIVNTITISAQNAGTYQLKIFVDDLGYNAPATVRDQSHLTAVGYALVLVKNPASTTTKSNKTILSVAIAAAAAAAAIIAAGIWKLVKKAAPPTDAFFGEGFWQGDGVNQNPLYTENQNNGVNPLYEAHNDA